MRSVVVAVAGMAIIGVTVGSAVLLRRAQPVPLTPPAASSPAEQRPQLIIGNADAPLTVIEYADFKCPNCNQFHRQAGKQLREEYVNPGKVRILFRAYPFLGPDSGRALRGAYCANSQGKFTEYHDAVFEYIWEAHYKHGDYAKEIADVLTAETLTTIARDIGVTKDKFSDCLNSTEHNRYIDEDLLLAADDRVQGTPTFIINGQRIVGPQPYAVFKTLIDTELQ